MSEEGEQKYPFSRCSSAGSLHTLTSSANNTDDEDSDLGGSNPGGNNNLKDKRRVAHTQAEQKRRDSIKKGYDALQDLVPMRTSGDSTQAKLSKATVLQKSIDYMQYLQNSKKKQEEELASLNKEAVAMTILKLNYDNIVAAHHNQQPGRADKQVSDQVKFQVFRAVLDSLYQTFEPSIITTNFAEISGSVISWLEEHCKPQILREIMCGVLQQLQDHEAQMNAAGIGSSPPNIPTQGVSPHPPTTTIPSRASFSPNSTSTSTFPPQPQSSVLPHYLQESGGGPVQAGGPLHPESMDQDGGPPTSSGGSAVHKVEMYY